MAIETERALNEERQRKEIQELISNQEQQRLMGE